MHTSLYGPGDNFHFDNSHLMPTLLPQFHESTPDGLEEVFICGVGKKLSREFLHVDDIAATSLFILNLSKLVYEANTEPIISHFNVWTGTDISILEFARIVAKVIWYNGKISAGLIKPDGAMHALMDVGRLTKMGWSSKISIEQGLADTYQWYLANM